MNTYELVFNKLRLKKETAFIPFAVAGDPNPEISFDIFKAYIDGGADILEIGYPFSDPVADGPVNQRAAIRSIESGFNHTEFFKLIKRIRAISEIPVGVLLYANTVIHLGYDTFCKRAVESGVNSLLVADMPPEESEELQKSMKKYGLSTVYIVSELTPQKRIDFICKQVSGFVYVVSRLGTTGTEQDLSTSVASTLKRIRKLTDKPTAVGFGLSTPDHVRAVKKAGANGAIVGSALVAAIEKNLNTKQLPSILKKMVQDYKKATTTA